MYGSEGSAVKNKCSSGFAPYKPQALVYEFRVQERWYRGECQFVGTLDA